MEEIILDEHTVHHLEKGHFSPVYATRKQRLLAGIVDANIYFLLLVESPLGRLEALLGTNFYSLLVILLLPCYKIGSEARFGGTLGKKLVGIKVVRHDGQYSPLRYRDAVARFALFWPMVGREIIGYLLFSALPLLGASIGKLTGFLEGWIPVTYFFVVTGIVSVFLNPIGRGWHDKIAGTSCIQTAPLFINKKNN